ncbi:MAG: TIGR02679 family protein, partial [Planctomycetes bacterium]|nr:TIGR02679 family protein [Planctomycetota bacterium]
LDFGTSLGALALRLAAALGEHEGLGDALGRREAWASVGVLLDELSAPVLVLNLRAEDDTFSGRQLALHAESGEPARLSARQLLRQPPRFSLVQTGARVFVCENPNVVAVAADRLGPDCAPLVCTEGQPATALRLLLDRLVAAGVQLVYHGDFDGDGLRIADLILRRHGARPWRFTALDYVLTAGGSELLERPASASWDPALESALRCAKRAVPEERLLDDLLRDLRGDKHRPEPGSETGPPPRWVCGAEFLASRGCPRRVFFAAHSDPYSSPQVTNWSSSPPQPSREGAAHAHARQAFPGGVPITASAPQAACEQTLAFLEAGATLLYGATFERGGLWIQIEVLRRTPDLDSAPASGQTRSTAWEALCFASAGEASADTIDRLALALWITQEADLVVKRCLVALLDEGAPRPTEGLNLVDASAASRRRALTLSWEAEAFERVATLAAAPQIELGPHCGQGSATPCPFLTVC